jgi:hypothetical protein
MTQSVEGRAEFAGAGAGAGGFLGVCSIYDGTIAWGTTGGVVLTIGDD